MESNRLRLLKTVAPRFGDREWVAQYQLYCQIAQQLGFPIPPEVERGWRIFQALTDEWQTARQLGQQLDLSISYVYIRDTIRVLSQSLPIEHSTQGYRRI